MLTEKYKVTVNSLAERMLDATLKSLRWDTELYEEAMRFNGRVPLGQYFLDVAEYVFDPAPWSHERIVAFKNNVLDGDAHEYVFEHARSQLRKSLAPFPLRIFEIVRLASMAMTEDRPLPDFPELRTHKSGEPLLIMFDD